MILIYSVRIALALALAPCNWSFPLAHLPLYVFESRVLQPNHTLQITPTTSHAPVILLCPPDKTPWLYELATRDLGSGIAGLPKQSSLQIMISLALVRCPTSAESPRPGASSTSTEEGSHVFLLGIRRENAKVQLCGSGSGKNSLGASTKVYLGSFGVGSSSASSEAQSVKLSLFDARANTRSALELD